MSLHFSAIKGKNILLITGYELVIPRSLAAGISPLLPFQGEGWDGGGVSAAKHKLSLVNRGQTELTPIDFARFAPLIARFLLLRTTA